LVHVSPEASVSVASQQALVQPLRRWDPEQVGGYVVLGRLGAGAMGQVYLGRSAAGRLVAIKMIKSELAEEPDFRTRFGQEVAAARRVSGAFTAAVVAADSEADVPWLATIYVPAPSLSRLVHSCGPLPVPAVRWLAAGCAEALEAIHGVGLVHRDLKPSNVLVSPDGPRVIDFGLARAAERIQLTVTRGSVGTPAYMAPEQARDTRQATGASDVFSLGATILFAATGHPPYQGETVMDVLVRLATEPPDLSGLPAELTEIVTACLERDPRSRPGSAAIVSQLAADGGLESAPLPAAAFALIDEYRGTPWLSGGSAVGPGAGPGSGTSGPADGGSDAGAGSGWDTGHGTDSGWSSAPGEAPGSGAGQDSDPTLGSHSGRASIARHAAAPARTVRAGTSSGRPRGWLVAGAVAAGIALAAGGWAAGKELSADRPAAAAGDKPSGSASVATSGSVSNPGATGNPNAAGLGPVIGQGPPGGPGSGGQFTSGTAIVAVSQPTGDPDTIFVIMGQSWPPLTRVTITLVSHGKSRTSFIHPITDRAGNFNYAINQDHEFFHGVMPVGIYTVRVTGRHGLHAQARFEVERDPLA
jgi:serine/threonine protein kinase